MLPRSRPEETPGGREIVDRELINDIKTNGELVERSIGIISRPQLMAAIYDFSRGYRLIVECNREMGQVTGGL